ncbi:ribonuclease P/MRP protein subunit Pop5p [[Candida] jaroonii]|uniref:Ribonuclease P/MRP protein subunit Pop5p n=1 Tax=[Candida] jaroonii TaxID=467808 RepID=A0ACA9YDW6_9ASCO|nr:ribonuclease P/MRP protein subunit Pop5p [[Candida] jaroonii]
MVRLKQRYILFEVLYPPTDGEDFQTYSESPTKALLSLHQESPPQFTPKTITNTIKSSIQELYGDYGSSFAVQLNMKYFNNKTSTGILRCTKTNFHFVTATLPLITTIEGRKVIVNCIHVSGTIKKCEDYAIKRNLQFMRRVRFLEKSENGTIITI